MCKVGAIMETTWQISKDINPVPQAVNCSLSSVISLLDLSLTQ